MRKIWKFTILTILSGLFLLTGFAAAQKTKEESSAGPPKEEQTDTKQTTQKQESSARANVDETIQFPDIEGWRRGEIRKYPTAALGYSVPYQSPAGGTVTVYVYNGGLKSIPDDINDKIIKNEIDKAKNEIVQVGKTGLYEDVKEIKSDTVILGGANGKIKALRSLFYFKVKGTEMDSEIYLFSYKNNFIKIRATRPKSADGKENKVFTAFMTELEKLFVE